MKLHPLTKNILKIFIIVVFIMTSKTSLSMHLNKKDLKMLLAPWKGKTETVDIMLEIAESSTNKFRFKLNPMVIDGIHYIDTHALFDVDAGVVLLSTNHLKEEKIDIKFFLESIKPVASDLSPQELQQRKVLKKKCSIQ